MRDGAERPEVGKGATQSEGLRAKGDAGGVQGCGALAGEGARLAVRWWRGSEGGTKGERSDAGASSRMRVRETEPAKLESRHAFKQNFKTNTTRFWGVFPGDIEGESERL